MALHPLIGHEGARHDLVRALDAGTLPSSLLFQGPRGVGKQRLALWLAQLVLCEARTPAGPCEACRSCRMSLSLEHPDIHWYFPLPRPTGAATPDKMADALEEARFARLTELRAQPVQRPIVQFLEKRPTVEGIYLAAVRSLRRRAGSRPSMSREQLFIVGDAETMVPQEASPEAANALLKLLEEPPDSTRFILTSSEPGSLLDTIRSRCVPVTLAPVPHEAVREFLVVHAGAEAPAADAAARLAAGSPGRALGHLADDDGGAGSLELLRKASVRMLRAALSPRPLDAWSEALETGTSGGRALTEVLASLEVWLRDLAAVCAGAPERATNHDSVEWLQRQATSAGIHAEAVTRCLALVDEAALQARGNVNPQLIVAGLLSRMRTVLHGGIA